MKKNLITIIVVITVLAVAVGLAAFEIEMNSNSAKIEPISPHYLSYNGITSKIYLVDAITSYSKTNETYTTAEGQTVQKGSSLFVITLTLRNDYSSDKPPPTLANQSPTSPVDGTAYVYLTSKLYNKDGAVNATNVSFSDFTLPATPGTGLVLASGQTEPLNISVLTSQTDINKCEVNLIFVGDSIPP